MSLKLPDAATALGERPIPVSSGPARGGRQVPSTDVAPIFGAAASRLESVADEMQRTIKVEQDRIDHLRSEEAFTKVREQQMNLTAGEQDGFTRVRGSAAVSGKLLETYTRRLDDTAKGIEEGLANDQQRERFRLRYEGIARQQFTNGLLDHLRREGEVYDKEVFDGTVMTELRSVTANWNRPNDVALSLERMTGETRRRAERLGWAPEYTEAVIQQNAGKAHSAIIGQAIASGDWVYAQNWYQEHKQDVDPQTAKQLERVVEDATQKQLTNGYQADFLASRDNPRSLESLERRVLADRDLDDARKNALVGRIQSRAETLAARAERDVARRERLIGRQITEINSTTLAGYEPNAEQLTQIVSAAKGTDLEADARQAVALANATGRFRIMDPVRQADYLAQLEAEVRKDPGKFDVKWVNAFRSIHESQRRAATEAPVSFAIRQGLVAPDSPAAQPLDLSKPDTLGDQLAARYALGRDMAQKYSVPFKPLNPEEVALVTSTLQNGSAATKSQWFAGLARSSRGDMEGYKAAVAQIAPDDPVTAIGGVYAGRSYQTADGEIVIGRGRQVSDLIFSGQSILRPNRKEDGQTKGGLWPMPKGADEKTMDTMFRDAEGNAFAGLERVRSDYQQTARAIYAKLTVDAGDSSGTLNPDRWRQSIKLATGGFTEIKGKRVMLPYGHDEASFRDGLRQRVDALVESGQVTKETGQKLRDLPLEMAGDGRYVFRSGDSVVLTTPAYGKPVVKNADGTVSTERTITVEADGRHYLVPTIVGGKEVPKDEAVRLWRAGTNKAVGDYASSGEADRAARQRTEAIGRALAPRPIIIDFNISAPFRTSGAHAQTSADDLDDATAQGLRRIPAGSSVFR